MLQCSGTSALTKICVSHIVERIESAVAEDHPFPHVFIADFFPPTVYCRILSERPDETFYQPFNYEKHATTAGNSTRNHFPLTARSIGRLDEPACEFWTAIRNALRSSEVRQATFTKLRRGLAFRYGIDPGRAAQLPGFAYPELFHETTGYYIKPHPDTRRKVVTMQVVLASDDSTPELGTQFYRRSFNPLTLLREPRGFELAQQAPFLPNFAYAFAVLNTLSLKSWHGRTTLAQGSRERHTLLNIWYEKAADAGPDYVTEVVARAA